MPPLRARRATVSTTVETALARALAPTPADRYQTAVEFAAALGAPPTDASAPGTTRQRLRALVVVGLLIALGAVGWLTSRGLRGATGDEALTTVAVLPFENLSPDSSHAYFAEGLADELVTSLSMVQGLRVAARTSTSALLRQGVDLKGIAQQLNVQTVLEGSLRVSGMRVRVATRLVKVADGSSIWSESYDREATDVLRIQEEVATAIVGAMRGRLVEGSLDAVASGTTDPEAYDLYLQGRSLRLRQSEQGLNRAVELFRAAIARSPEFARAYAGLAESHAVQGFYDFRPPREAFPAAMRAAAEALRLDPRNASAQATIAYASLYYEWDLPRAKREFSRAIAMDPNSPIAHQWYGNFLTVAERWDEAEAEFRTALRLDPTAPVRHAVLAWVQSHRGDHARAIESFQQAAQFDSSYAVTFQWGAVALEQAGRIDDAVVALRRAVTLADEGANLVAALARALAVRGDRAEAEELLRKVLAARVVPAYEVAKVYLELGNRAEAIRWLERAFEARAHSMVFLKIDPQLAKLRGDPALVALIGKVGLGA